MAKGGRSRSSATRPSAEAASRRGGPANPSSAARRTRRRSAAGRSGDGKRAPLAAKLLESAPSTRNTCRSKRAPGGRPPTSQRIARGASACCAANAARRPPTPPAVSMAWRPPSRSRAATRGPHRRSISNR